MQVKKMSAFKTGITEKINYIPMLWLSTTVFSSVQINVV